MNPASSLYAVCCSTGSGSPLAGERRSLKPIQNQGRVTSDCQLSHPLQYNQLELLKFLFEPFQQDSSSLPLMLIHLELFNLSVQKPCQFLETSWLNRFQFSLILKKRMHPIMNFEQRPIFPNLTREPDWSRTSMTWSRTSRNKECRLRSSHRDSRALPSVRWASETPFELVGGHCCEQHVQDRSIFFERHFYKFICISWKAFFFLQKLSEQKHLQSDLLEQSLTLVK